MEEKETLTCRICGFVKTNWRKIVGSVLIIAGIVTGSGIVRRSERVEEDAPAEEAAE